MSSLNLLVATVNGSGSQSANTILLKTFFRMGFEPGSKNLFPSNIAGLPTWFAIRLNEKGYTGYEDQFDIVVNLNSQTLKEDIKKIKPTGFLITGSEQPGLAEMHAPERTVAVPFKKLVDLATDQGKIKKYLTNMIYVGVLAELLSLPEEVLQSSMENQLGTKAKVLESNRKAVQVGRAWVQEQKLELPFRLPSLQQQGLGQQQQQGTQSTSQRVLMDGNTAGALGLLFGGCSFLSWYPITPSTSLAEAFEKYAKTYRRDSEGKNKFAIVQTEDELASICMALGAGWAGLRAMTTTSGPGMSLMAETAGYSYYAEVPVVIWNVQRVGPSTGMPTRSAQGDLLSAAYLSHGDTQHPLLIPGNVQEAFEFGQTCFDLAERLQTLVIVMSDLDLGMNLWSHPSWKYPEKPYDRGFVLNEKDFDQSVSFVRYSDVHGDGISPRTLPGLNNPAGSYFTRGSGHSTKAAYTESSFEYEEVMEKLKRKWQTARKLMPEPIIKSAAQSSKKGILYYGSLDSVVNESWTEHLDQKFNLCRVRSFPFTDQVLDFIRNQDVVYVIDQNRDAQMKKLLINEHPEFASKLKSICHYNGWPLDAGLLSRQVKELL